MHTTLVLWSCSKHINPWNILELSAATLHEVSPIEYLAHSSALQMNTKKADIQGSTF